MNTMNIITEWIDKATKFVEDNYNSPWFWLITFLVLLALGLFIVSRFADK